MTRVVQVERLGPAGAVPGLEVVGVHGRLDERMTPARCSPVYAFDGKLAAVDARDLPGTGRVRIEVSDVPDATDPLPGEGTRLHRWPARLSWVLTVLGPREQAMVEQIRWHALRGSEPHGRLLRFFNAWAGGTPHPDDPCTFWNDRVFVWYAPVPDTAAAWQAVEAVALKEWDAAVRGGDLASLQGVSFWLSRAAVSDDAVYRAASGLRHCGVASWELVVRAGMPDADDAERRSGIERAQRRLDQLLRFPRDMRKSVREDQTAESQRAA